MARLTGQSAEQIAARQAEAAQGFSREYGCVTVLKSHRTVTAVPDGTVWFNPTGNASLAKGGSGDVLAGVVGSLAAQGYDLFDALTVGAFLHGRAGERLAARFGAHGALPSQLPEEIGRLLG